MRNKRHAFIFLLLLPACGGGESSAPLPPSSVSAPAVPTLRWVGANAGMAEISPSGPYYVKTDRGDLFDIAHAAGLNIFRVIDWMPPGITVPNYTAADWQLVRARAQATHIAIVPVLSQVTGDLSVVSGEDAFVMRCESKADMILAAAGFANSQALAFVDIVNEPLISGWAPDAFSRITSYIHAKYPGVSVTVGGWGPIINSGSAISPILDVTSPHLYSQDNIAFADMAPSQETRASYSELQIVDGFPSLKQVVVEEFGTPDGLLAPSDGISTLPGSADLQARHTDAMLASIAQAMGAGAPVTGALQWILYPAGGPAARLDRSNADSLLVPAGHGQPLEVMPAIVELCKATASPCAGAEQLVSAPPIQE